MHVYVYIKYKSSNVCKYLSWKKNYTDLNFIQIYE